MKREKTIIAEPTTKVIRWKNAGGGSFRLNRKIIKPGQVFDADEKDIPKAFRDIIKPYETVPITPIPPTPGKVPVYELKEREQITEIKGNTKRARSGDKKSGASAPFELKANEKEESLWDIVGVNGKILNSKPLPKKEAEALLKSISS